MLMLMLKKLIINLRLTYLTLFIQIKKKKKKKKKKKNIIYKKKYI